MRVHEDQRRATVGIGATAGCIAAEPALGRVQDILVGGLRLPGDEISAMRTCSRAASRPIVRNSA